ncbi:MAG: nicotinate phosphoribosyltransferase [Hydrogenothermaceae bacterium]|nr:nicotinate phosphoribosyltransferase [Hydrogenothermaceae bacterium]
MKVADYIERGLKNLVEEKPEDYRELGKAKSGCHQIVVYIKDSGNKIEDVKIKVTKRCKKLLAIADLVAEISKNKGRIEVNEEEILNFFKEEKEIDKMKDRINLIKSAIGS